MVVVVTLTLLGGLGGEELREGLEERLCCVVYLCLYAPKMEESERERNERGE